MHNISGTRMNYLDVFCFTSVARTRSFSITARELMISQQAVSRHIKGLEDELGFPLFLRNFQNVQLTDAGELMLEYFLERSKLLSPFTEASVHLTEQPGLSIGCSQWLGCPDWFQTVLRRFSERFPDAGLYVHDLTADEAWDALENEKLDMLLTTRYASGFLPVSWRIEPISEEPIYLMGGSQLDREKLRTTPFPFFAAFAGEPDEGAVRARLLAGCRKIGIRAQSVEVLPDMGSVCLNILLTDSLAFVVNKTPIEDNPDYALLPVGYSATCVLCLPFQSQNPLAAEFMRLLPRREGSL